MNRCFECGCLHNSYDDCVSEEDKEALRKHIFEVTDVVQEEDKPSVTFNPIGNCEKCSRPVYLKEGFCGACNPSRY